MPEDKDYSNQIAWGIIKASFVIYIGYYILIPLLSFFGITSATVVYVIATYYKEIFKEISALVETLYIITVCFILGLGILYALYKGFLHSNLKSWIGHRLNQNHTVWRIIGLCVAGFCLFMLVLSGLAHLNMDRPYGSGDKKFDGGLFLIIWISTFLALKKATSKKKQYNEVDFTLKDKTPTQNTVDKSPNQMLTKSTFSTSDGELAFDEPISSLYCYQCTRKIGLKAWEKDQYYFCKACIDRLDHLSK